MASSSGGRGAGVGVLGLLGVAFVVLKLCNVIEWEWIWVLAPFWIPAAVGLCILVIAGLFAVLAVILEKK